MLQCGPLPVPWRQVLCHLMTHSSVHTVTGETEQRTRFCCVAPRIGRDIHCQKFLHLVSDFVVRCRHVNLKHSTFGRTTANIRINFILPETRVPKLHDSCLYLILCNCFRKQRKNVVNERYRTTQRGPLMPLVENLCECPYKPYIAKSKSPCRKFALLTVWVYLY